MKLWVTELIGLNKWKAQVWISGMAGSSSSHYVFRTPTFPIFWIWFCLCGLHSLSFPTRLQELLIPRSYMLSFYQFQVPWKYGFCLPKVPLKILELISLALLAGLQTHAHHHGQDGAILWLPRTGSHATLETGQTQLPQTRQMKTGGVWLPKESLGDGLHRKGNKFS